MAEPEADQLSWRATPAHAPVLTTDGKEVGHVIDVAALANEDIFHGIVFRQHTLGHAVLAPAADVAKITSDAVHLSVDSAAAAAYEPFQEMSVQHLGVRGIFNWKHLGWKKTQE